MPESTLPIEWERAPLESSPIFFQEMKKHIQAKLPEHYTSQSTHEIRVLYDREMSDWKFSRKVVRVDGSRADIDVRLDQPLKAPDGRHSYAIRPESIVDAAFEVSQNCVISQLAPRLCMIEDKLDDLFGKAALELYGDGEYPFGQSGAWSANLGVTPRMILVVCKRLGVSCHGFADCQKVLQYVPEGDRDISISLSFGNGHLWLMEQDVNRSLAQKPPASQKPHRLLHPLDEFPIKPREEIPLLPWADDPFDVPPVGIFYTTDPNILLQVRKAMLERGRCPRVWWNTRDDARLIKYNLTKSEGKGTFTLRAFPPE